MRSPNAHSPSGAPTLVNVTSYEADSPGANVIVSGLTLTPYPAGAVTLAVKVTGSVATLVTVRVTVSTPASSAMPIDG